MYFACALDICPSLFAQCVNLHSSAGLGGGIVWEAATVLTRFLVQPGHGPSQLPRRGGPGGCAHILELGSGTGVCGLVAAG